MPCAPDADDGPKRFIRRWLTFDDNRPVHLKTMWMLIATMLVLLTASALLAWLNTSMPN